MNVSHYSQNDYKRLIRLATHASTATGSLRELHDSAEILIRERLQIALDTCIEYSAPCGVEVETERDNGGTHNRKGKQAGEDSGPQEENRAK